MKNLKNKFKASYGLLLLVVSAFTITSCQKETIHPVSPETIFEMQADVHAFQTGVGNDYPAGVKFIGSGPCQLGSLNIMTVLATQTSNVAGIKNLLGNGKTVKVNWSGNFITIPPFIMNGIIYRGTGEFDGYNLKIDLDIKKVGTINEPFATRCPIRAKLHTAPSKSDKRITSP